MDWSIEDCINYCKDHDLIGFVNHTDLLIELEDLRADQEYLTNLRLYGEEGKPNDKTSNDN